VLVIRNLTKSLGGRTLFEEADMTINWGERVALVGPNGAGKSTLFKMILGEEDADTGTVERDDYAITGYLAQEAGDPGEETILEIAIGITPELQKALRVMREGDTSGKTDTPEYHAAQDTFDAANGYQLEPKAKKILAGLGFKQDAFDQPANKFSGGWIMRSHLAQLLVKEPDLLMLDEPTNHLDLMALIWLQQYLKTYPGALLMISHDRDFMDGLIETVYEIDEEQLISYTGNYTSYLDQRQKRYTQKVQAYRNQQKEFDRLQEFIDRFRSVTSKAAQVQSRVKQMEKMKRLPKPIKPRKVFKFNFPQPKRSNQKVIELEKIKMAYDDNVIYENLELVVERGDRMVLVGPNGAGKSTLLKILAGQLEFQEGERNAGFNTNLGYYSQHRTQSMDESNTVLEEVMASGGDMREDEARSILGSFLFRRADVHKKVRVLSGGEKSRLNLVKFLVNPPNLLLMDEPTTHLDIISIEALLQALKHYEGTLVFISHDVHFIRNLAEVTLHVGPDHKDPEGASKLTRYAGGYDYYLEKSGLDDGRGAVTA
jgi:ATP-binding cassette subfamily F protein 3